MCYFCGIELGGGVTLAAEYYENNTGESWETAYVISSVNDFRLMRDRINDGSDTGSYYKLSVDIDITSDTTWVGINAATQHIDGQNHTVKVSIDREGDNDVGLFSHINGEEVIVKNLNVSGIVRGNWAGGITWGFNAGIIENCSFTGTVESTGDWAGGFVDLMGGGTIKDSTFSGKVISTMHSGGGFVAELSYGNIENCITKTGTEISGVSYAGGVIGLMHGGYVKNCSTDITLNTASSQGGIVGGATTSVQSNLSGNKWPSKYTEIGLVSDTLPDDPEEIDNEINNNNNNSIDTNTNSRSYIHGFELTTGLKSKILAAFPGLSESEIFQFLDSEIIADTWTLDTEDSNSITALNEILAINLPTVKPSNSGVYVMRFNLGTTQSGTPLKIHGVTINTEASIRPSALDEMEYVFFDEDYNQITNVPSSGVVYAAVKMTSGQTRRGVITTETSQMPLPIGTVTPIEEDKDLLDTIAEVMEIDRDKIYFLREDQIFDALEPDQELRDKVKNDSAELLGKLSTLSVDVEGYYVFRVTLSDDLFQKLDGTKIDNLKIYYAVYDTLAASSVSFQASFLTGLLNSWEILTMSGEKMEFCTQDFLMVGFLNAGQPLSLYIAKMLLLMLGGCDTGVGIFSVALIFLAAGKYIHRR